MRIWPFSPSLANEITFGGISFVYDQIELCLLLRRSKRIDRFLASAEETRRKTLPEPASVLSQEARYALARENLIKGIDAWLAKKARERSIARDI